MRSILTAASLLAIAAASSANIVTNGGFEANPYGSGGHVVPTTVTGWTQLTNASVAGIGVGYLGATSQEVDLSGVSDDMSGVGLYQDLATVAGQRYTLSLDVYTGGDRGHNGGVDVRIGNASLLASNLQGFTRTNYSYTFVATGALTRLSLSSNHGNVSHVDNVDVAAAVPGPAAMASFAIGALRMRRRRK